MARFTQLAARGYESPVVTTWASLALKLSSHAIILPMALNKLGVAELNLWLLFYSFAAIGMLLDFGFSATFIRFVAYSQDSKTSVGCEANAPSAHNFESYNLATIIGAMVFVYRRLALICGLSLAVFGSFAIAKPIGEVPDAAVAWSAWAVTIVGTTLTLNNSMYGAFLQGSKNIALYRRWESVTGLFAILAALICLSLSSSLLYLVVALQVAPVVGMVVYRWLANRFEFNRLYEEGKVTSRHEPVIVYIWSAAWRSGLGVAATIGAVNGGNVLLAQFLPASILAPYLLAQRIIAATVAFASPQFHTAIPRFVRLFKQGDAAGLIGDAGRRFIRTNWSLAIALVTIAFIGSFLLQVIGSEVNFISIDIWMILTVGAILERSGAMHIQLYSLTNKILWHIANGVTGLIILMFLYPALVYAGLYGVSVVVAFAYAVFYVPFCMVHSYRQYSLTFSDFDFKGLFGPLIFVLVFGSIAQHWAPGVSA